MAAKRTKTKRTIPVGYADIEQFASQMTPAELQQATETMAMEPWKQIFLDNFPAYSYLFDKAATDPEIMAMLERAAKEDWFLNPDGGRAKLQAALEATTYYKTTSSKILQFDGLKEADKQNLVGTNKQLLISQYGNLGLNDAQLSEVSTAITRQGLTGVSARNFYVGYAAGMTQAQPNTMAPSQYVQKTETADDVRKIARDYWQSATEQDILDVSTGKKTTTDFQTEIRARAASLYPHLKEALDAGNTLDSLSSSYKSNAAKILEKDESQIDFMEPMFQEALAKRMPDGTIRQQTIGEWMDTIKTDRRYGYQYTKKANSDARSLVQDIIKGFGGY